MQKFNWKTVLGALVSAVIVAVLMYLATLTRIADVSLNHMLDVAFVAGVASLLKNIGTTREGKFAGVPVKEPSR